MSKVLLLKGHTGDVNQLKLCQDGRHAVTCSHDTTIRIWDINEGKCLHVIEGHQDIIWPLTLHPDGRRIISASRDRTLRIWEIDTGKCLGVLQMTPKSYPGDFVSDEYILHPDGQLIISWNQYNSRIKIWNINTLECIKVIDGHKGYVHKVILHPDGKRLISWALLDDENSIMVWDLQSGECLQSLNEYINTVEGVSFCPDGRRLLIWSRSPDFDEEGNNPKDPKGLIWDLETNKPIVYLNGHKYLIGCIMPHPDGKRLVSVGDTIKIWDENGNCLSTITHDKAIGFMEFHPDGQRLLAGNGEDIHIWDIDKGLCKYILKGHEKKVQYGSFIPNSNNKLLITYSYDDIRIWNIDDGRCLHILSGHPSMIYDILLHFDGNRLLSKGGDLRLWNIKKGECIEVMNEHSGHINDFLLHPDGERVISWDSDGNVCVWQLPKIT